MPKMKTHKGAAKRVRLTAKGKLKRKKAGAGHLMSHKSGNRCRSLRKKNTVTNASLRRMKEALLA